MSPQKEGSELINKIITFIMYEADARALLLIGNALENRKKSLGIKSNFQESIARKTANNITNQLSSLVNIKEVTREMVRNMILKFSPDITEEHLNLLTEMWTPSTNSNQSSEIEKNLPREAILTMVKQFLSYSLGMMSIEEQQTLPENWSKRYWQAFSLTTQELIKRFINGEIEVDYFWEALQTNINS